MKNKKTKTEMLKAEIKTGEKFFKPYELDKNAFDESWLGVNGNVETVFLYIPNDIQVVRDIFLN